MSESLNGHQDLDEQRWVMVEKALHARELNDWQKIVAIEMIVQSRKPFTPRDVRRTHEIFAARRGAHDANAMTFDELPSALEWRLYRSYDARLKDKDEEIKRISAERDMLQQIILKNRLTTEKHKGGKS